MEEYIFEPIGYIRTEAKEVPRHWSISEVEGEIVLNPELQVGLTGLQAGDKIVVIFCFHKSPPFSLENLLQKPPHQDSPKGVFSLCSPLRPNPIGFSILKIMAIEENIIKVKGLDILDGTPVLDIKPFKEIYFESNKPC